MTEPRAIALRKHSHQPTCRDCGVSEGETHILGCDAERCPWCGGQLISCLCAYKVLKLWDPKTYGYETAHLPPAVYTEGLSDAQRQAWQDALETKGRVPYIIYPVLCARCGVLWPDFFSVPDAEWRQYIEKGERDKVLCRHCYDTIKRLIDAAP